MGFQPQCKAKLLFCHRCIRPQSATKVAKGHHQVLPYGVVVRFVLLSDAELHGFHLIGADEGAEDPIPDGEFGTDVPVEMLRVVAVVYLMLEGTDEDVFEPIEVTQGYVRMPQIGTEDQKGKAEDVGTDEGDLIDGVGGEVAEDAHHQTHDHNAFDVVEDEFDRMDAVLGNGIEHRGRMMNLMEFPQKGNVVHEIMDDVGSEVIGNGDDDGVKHNGGGGRKCEGWVTDDLGQPCLYLVREIEPEDEVRTDEEHFEQRVEEDEAVIDHGGATEPYIFAEDVIEEGALDLGLAIDVVGQQ